MLTVSIIHHYLWWHYTSSLVAYLRVTKNMWWFLVQLFSLSVLARSLFAPLKRIQERRTRAWDIEDMAGVMLVNFMSRLLGAGIRLVIIISGLVTLVLFSALSIFFYAVWLLAPAVMLGSIAYGVWLLW